MKDNQATDSLNSFNNSNSLDDMLKRMTVDELREFVAEYAKEDENFARAIASRFSLFSDFKTGTETGNAVKDISDDGNSPKSIETATAKPSLDFDAEVEKVTSMAQKAVEKAVSRRSGWELEFDLDEVYQEIYDRIDSGDFRIACAQMAAAFLELMKAFDFQEEHELTDEGTDLLRTIDELLSKATDPKDREYIFDRIVRLIEEERASDSGGSFGDDLLKFAIALVSEAKRGDLEAAIAGMGLSENAAAKARLAIGARLLDK